MSRKALDGPALITPGLLDGVACGRGFLQRLTSIVDVSVPSGGNLPQGHALRIDAWSRA